jgi:hypothetical protein
MSATPPTYDELLHALQQLELRFQALEKSHADLLTELQTRLIKIQESIDAGLPRPSPTP